MAWTFDIVNALGSTTVLIDPVFGNAAPVPFAVRRFTKPAIERTALPDIDVVLISHDHYDHLERKTILYLKYKKTHFIVPLGVSAYLMGWGIPESRITVLDWWEQTLWNGLTFVCTPSQHFSGRRGPRGNHTLWASWTVLGSEQRFYFSGDSGFDLHFKEIGDRYGQFDVAFIEAGQYNTIWPMSHLFPNESVDAAMALKAKHMQPIHWSMFKLSTHDWNEPVIEVLSHASGVDLGVLTPKVGELLTLESLPNFETWWLP